MKTHIYICASVFVLFFCFFSDNSKQDWAVGLSVRRVCDPSRLQIQAEDRIIWCRNSQFRPRMEAGHNTRTGLVNFHQKVAQKTAQYSVVSLYRFGQRKCPFN